MGLDVLVEVTPAILVGGMNAELLLVTLPRRCAWVLDVTTGEKALGTGLPDEPGGGGELNV